MSFVMVRLPHTEILKTHLSPFKTKRDFFAYAWTWIFLRCFWCVHLGVDLGVNSCMNAGVHQENPYPTSHPHSGGSTSNFAALFVSASHYFVISVFLILLRLSAVFLSV